MSVDSTSRRYRKRPVVISAYQTPVRVYIQTLEGTMMAEVGDYVVTGTAGERYPVKGHLFHELYERVDDDDTTGT